MEVSQIARSIALALGGHEALTEAIVLSHDLGHPPFGHAGERALDNVLRELGESGFNANTHSLEVVDYLERATSVYRGLNLTLATREGIAKHSTPFDTPLAVGEFSGHPNGGLECQIVDVADVLAYLTHDLDDALLGDFITISEISRGSSLLAAITASCEREWANKGDQVWPPEERLHIIRRTLIARLVGACISDVVKMSGIQLSEPPRIDDAIRNSQHRTVVHSKGFEKLIRNLLALLGEKYYGSTEIRKADKDAEVMVKSLFRQLLAEPAHIPTRFKEFQHVSIARAAANFLASLNERAARDLAEGFGFSESN